MKARKESLSVAEVGMRCEIRGRLGRDRSAKPEEVHNTRTHTQCENGYIKKQQSSREKRTEYWRKREKTDEGKEKVRLPEMRYDLS